MKFNAAVVLSVEVYGGSGCINASLMVLSMDCCQCVFLLINVLRRFIPHALLVSLLAFNALLFSVSFSYATIFIVQLLCLAGLLVFTRGDWEARTPESLYRLLFAVAYVAAGLYGTLLGTLDVLRGEKYVTWTPKKS